MYGLSMPVDHSEKSGLADDSLADHKTESGEAPDGRLTFRSKGALARLRRDLKDFHAAERRVAQAFLDQPASIVGLSVTQVADQASVSEATVVRFCQSLGFSGFAEFKIHLASEIAEPFSIVHADIKDSDEAVDVLHKVFRSEMRCLYDTLSIVDHTAFLNAVAALAGARSVLIFGVGTSGPIALDAAYRFEQLGIPAAAVIDSIQMAVAALNIDPKSVALGVSNSGATRATLDAMRLARSAGAKTICITTFERSPIINATEIPLVVAAQEMHYRFEAMASRLAHLALLDALCIAIAHVDPQRRESHLRRSAEVIARHRL